MTAKQKAEAVEDTPERTYPTFRKDDQDKIVAVTWLQDDQEVTLEVGGWFLAQLRLERITQITDDVPVLLGRMNNIRVEMLVGDVVQVMDGPPAGWPTCLVIGLHPEEKDRYVRCERFMEHPGEHRYEDVVWVGNPGWVEN